jgi:Flp pilus assembly pilin Flp
LSTLVREEHGQDVLEYALLGAAIGLAGASALALVSANLTASYSTWDSGVQNLWQMPAPTGS